MSTLKKLSFFALILLTAACSMPGLAINNPLPAAALPDALDTPDSLFAAPPDATVTATPFQPLPPTPVITPAEIPTLTPVPTATATPYVIPTELAEQIPEEVPGQKIILLLGADSRPGDTAFRTDTIIVLVLNPKQGTASLLSFPRDLYVNIPGWGTDRINTAFFRGGYKTLAATLQSNFGVKPDAYVLINFRSFKQIIDGLGGLDVRVGQPVRDRYPRRGWITVNKGLTHMNADMVLWYARTRKTTNDFARNRRQQEVLVALFEKLVSLDAIKQAPELYNKYKKAVTTNLTFGDMLGFIPLAIQLTDTTRIKRYYISPEMVWDYITPGGAMVLLPREDAIRGVVRKALKVK
ncbi:MAG: LCP family protein [Anaerolineales bacterium]|nr:LCP family protein [Anaerolineales bacterium]